MMEETEREIINLPLRFNTRLLNEHFGMKKYPKPARALCELVANSLGAEATRVAINFKLNTLDGIETIIVSDNGYGISRATLEERFSEVGALPAADRQDEFSRFGVGRYAVFRFGATSRWTSVFDSKEGRRQASFVMRANGGEQQCIIERVSDDIETGTTVEIIDLYKIPVDQLSLQAITSELLSQFCSFLLGHPDREILVSGEAVDLSSIIERREQEVFPFAPQEGIAEEVMLDHLMLKRSVERSRIPAPLLYCAKGRTILASPLENSPSPNYLGIIQCAHLDSLVTENREELLEMDSAFPALQALVESSVDSFGERWQEERKKKYIERARNESFYPYIDAPSDPITRAQQDIYDVVLEKVHESINLDGMNARQRSIIFRLLERVLSSNDALEVVAHVIGLGDHDMATFRRVLEHTRLSSIVRLSSEVTARLRFLDILHELVYGPDYAKHLKERSQLHKIIEPNCWLFGQQYHLASSDKGFRTVIQRHREAVGIPSVDEDAMNAVNGIDDIPDLFLAAKKDYVVQPKHHHLLVEIKAPKIPLGTKERDQIRRYAKTIRNSHEFDKSTTCWDLFLVSARSTDEIDDDRNQLNRLHGCLDEWDNMRVWAFEWSELISVAREEMQLVREHLQRTSEELSVSNYLRENFPEILGKLEGD